ncbi:rhodanese-like domain-containing protein [Fodinicola acaciae]|uniref:rhodanese-like domain-containing protein n=1 Tax=Fodinicola acaciae TaxID=2681555 RepID=UPI001C9E50FE|nr:rhodanese-like domain-containing protein [Fodinicola acaciae]
MAERVDVSVAHAVWQAGDTFLDVRTPDEYAHGHIPGALYVPIDELAVRARELPAGQLITVCSMGNRSWRAARLLDLAGRSALSLDGGTKAWEAAGHPLVRGPEPGARRRSWWR